MAQLEQDLHGPVGSLMVVDGDAGVVLLPEGTEAVGIGAAHIGYADEGQLRGGVVEPAAQEDEAAELFLPLQDSPLLHLVGVGVDLPEDHGTARSVDLPGDSLEHIGEKQVPGAPDHHADGVGLAADQIPGAVVGDVALPLHHGEDLAADRLADIGAVIENAGHGGNADAALSGNIPDSHGSASSLLIYAVDK